MNETFTARPATVSSTYDRQRMLADLSSRGFSPVAYVAISQLVFGDARLDRITVHAETDVDRTAVIVTATGEVTFQSIDGDWHDSLGIPLSAADDKVLDEKATWLVGGGEQ